VYLKVWHDSSLCEKPAWIPALLTFVCAHPALFYSSSGRCQKLCEIRWVFFDEFYSQKDCWAMGGRGKQQKTHRARMKGDSKVRERHRRISRLFVSPSLSDHNSHRLHLLPFLSTVLSAGLCGRHILRLNLRSDSRCQVLSIRPDYSALRS